MFYFTIVRHGETVTNVAKIIQSRTGGELTPQGMLMAQQLGVFLKEEKFTKIFSSDLQRCQDTTAQIIAQLDEPPVTPVEYTALLQERDLGQWEGLSWELAKAKRVEMDLPPHKIYQIEVPTAETYDECKTRASTFFEKIIQLVQHNQNGNVLAVSHGNLICCLLQYFMDNPAKFKLVNFTDDDLKDRGGNTARTRFSIGVNSAGIFTLDFTHKFNTQHLD